MPVNGQRKLTKSCWGKTCDGPAKLRRCGPFGMGADSDLIIYINYPNLHIKLPSRFCYIFKFML